MDAIRYYLAFSVFAKHFSNCTGFDTPWLNTTSIGGFFAMSGFLIFRSYEKSPDVIYFLRRRALRILPPYISVILFAFLCGLLITTLSSTEYLSSSHTWRYMLANLTFLNFLEPTLPGVFENNLLPTVNGSLWTTKVQWGFYLTVPIVAWIMSRFKVGKIETCSFIIVFSILFRLGLTLMFERTGNELYYIMGKQFLGMMSFFYSGVLFHLLCDKILKYRWLILGISIGLLLISNLIPYYSIIISPISTTALVLILCYTGTWGRFLDNKNNFSYDIFLFHFPIIQLWISFGLGKMPIWCLFACCAISVIIISWASWTFIGKRFVLMRERK